MIRMIDENEDAIIAALAEDLGRPTDEARIYDVYFPRNEIRHVRKCLAAWAAPTAVGDTLLTFPSESTLTREPYGVALVVGTWNYPIMLCLLRASRAPTSVCVCCSNGECVVALAVVVVVLWSL